MGCDGLRFMPTAFPLMFQSTHPHGVRQETSEENGTSVGFQSTHPHGVRLHFFYVRNRNLWFQSTHPHGVRPTGAAEREATTVSIHAPTWGATDFRNVNAFQRWFQSTHPHGVRHTIAFRTKIPIRFQSTHPHGVRLWCR